MNFTRTKKLVFFNNKGGVGKTTLAYNTAVKFAENGYKTVLIDLDPQCNLSLLAMGDYFIQKHLLPNEGDIYTVLKKVVEGGGDIDTSVKFEKIGSTGNLFLLPGSSNLSQYENSLITSWGEAAIGQDRGFFSTSAISRFLDQKALSEEIDVIIIDTSPTLGLLNRVIFLDSHYFITPLMPDAFSIQGIRNLGNIFSEWRENWKVTSKVLAKNKGISSDKVLDGDSLFIGYTINSYNQYSQQPIKANREWIEQIPELVKENISEKHGKNGLVEQSWKEPLAIMKDYGALSPISQEKNKAIFNLIPTEDFQDVQGTRETLEKSKEEFETLFKNIEKILKVY
ncbi:MAG: AAA family ATPase [Candidatus Pacebacteria bacterium]|nr:AAA family ATPase [Candidatus Paceibacterota bacterium]